MNIKNLDDLKKFTDEIRSQAGYKDPIAFAIGRSIKSKSAKTISVNYAVVNMNENYGSAAVLSWAIEKNGIKINKFEIEVLQVYFRENSKSPENNNMFINI